MHVVSVTKGLKNLASLNDTCVFTPEIKPYSCKICDEKFSRVDSLKYHLVIHTGDKPLTCKLCDKTYAQSGHRKSHLRIPSDDKPWPFNV